MRKEYKVNSYQCKIQSTIVFIQNWKPFISTELIILLHHGKKDNINVIYSVQYTMLF